MSVYTTGELARLCGVTVRTVQYYDVRGILIPSSLSEGGRRMYSENDLRRMKIICFLRELGLSINAISQLLSDESPEKVLSLLIEQQESKLKREIAEHQEKLAKLSELNSELKSAENFSLESIGDIAYRMENRKKLRKVHMTLLAVGVPIQLLQCFGIMLWIKTGTWWPFLVLEAASILCALLVSRRYFQQVKYICPQCHTPFAPSYKEALFANHTPKTRRLTCRDCGCRSFCVEVFGGENA